MTVGESLASQLDSHLNLGMEYPVSIVVSASRPPSLLLPLAHTPLTRV